MATSSFSARIPEDLHQAIKDYCQEQSISQADFLIEAATVFLGHSLQNPTIEQRFMAIEQRLDAMERALDI
ncbi:hypothetical protein U2F10_23800 [Leptothoe sp. EHU-05/26/07-4]